MALTMGSMDPKKAARDAVEALLVNGGALVAAGECSAAELEAAQAAGRFLPYPGSPGLVRRPAEVCPVPLCGKRTIGTVTEAEIEARRP